MGRIKRFKRNQQKAQKEFESGRSMVEMLGVLAIIGVLSVAGIAGYSTAMSKHKANEIMQSVSIANQEMQLGHVPQFLEVGGVTFGTKGTYNGAPAFVTVNVTDKSVCKALQNLASGPYIVEGSCE